MSASVATPAEFEAPIRRRAGFVRAGTSFWLQAYAFIAFAFFSGALDRPLSGNPSSYVNAGESASIQIVGSILIFIAGLITGRRLLFRSKAHTLSLSTIVLILSLLCAWVLLSIAWSNDPALSFRRGVAFVGTVLTGWTIAAYLPKDQSLLILGRGAMLLIAVSALLAVVSPHYAYHQAGEGGAAEHIGRMRGSFAHKNDFARMLALAVLLTVTLRPPLFGSRWPAIAATAVGLVLLSLAGSAKVMVALPAAVVGAVVMQLCTSASQRVGLLVFVGVPALFLQWSGLFEEWSAQVFAALGRDTSMSGRDVIWAVAERSIAHHWLVGQGYAAGWAAQAQAELRALEGVTIGHAHNGYLQAILDLGIVGLALALVPLAYILYDAIFHGPRGDKTLHVVATSFALFFIITNITGSYLTNYNDIFTVLLIYLAVLISRKRREYRLFLKRKQLAAIERYRSAGAIVPVSIEPIRGGVLQ
jgi:O-antigen ligase